MARYDQTSVDVLAWSEASAAAPCPTCGGTSECSVLEDGGFVRCVAVVSDRPVMTGGWLHSIGAAQRASREADHAGDTCTPYGNERAS
jgi:hypothetical protein